MVGRNARIFLAFLVGAVVAAPTARADLAIPGVKRLRANAVVLADRFDDYCDHRHVVVAGDTLEKITKETYGDAARVADLVKANPGIVPETLLIGASLVLPAKRTAPADAKETLAWTFWSYSRLSPRTWYVRVHPGERFASPGNACGLVAVPAAKAGSFAQLVAKYASQQSFEELHDEAPWMIEAEGFVVASSARDRSAAAESTTTLRITELAEGPAGKARFRLKSERTEFVDEKGKSVKAGFALGPETLPLALIALAGALSLARMRSRRSAGARSSG